MHHGWESLLMIRVLLRSVEMSSVLREDVLLRRGCRGLIVLWRLKRGWDIELRAVIVMMVG